MPRTCQAYLVLNAASDPILPAVLAAALGKQPVASVLLIPGNCDKPRLKALAAACQQANAAVLIEQDSLLAQSVAADGVHLPYAGSAEVAEGQYRQARSVLGGSAIVGVATGLSRHDAMVMAELGADYVAFEAAKSAEANEARVRDHIAWWAEMFEVPCVAWSAANASDVNLFSAAGADFVELSQVPVSLGVAFAF